MDTRGLYPIGYLKPAPYDAIINEIFSKAKTLCRLCNVLKQNFLSKASYKPYALKIEFLLENKTDVNTWII